MLRYQSQDSCLMLIIKSFFSEIQQGISFGQHQEHSTGKSSLAQENVAITLLTLVSNDAVNSVITGIEY